MADGYFFNGRLWVTPSVMSLVNDSAMQPANLSVGNNLCIIGQSAGGTPLVPTSFSSPSAALAVLQSGPLCDAVVRAFAPSTGTNAPATVMAVRVGQATQATLSLLDATSADVIDLTTVQYGLSANLTSVKIAAGSTVGKAVTITNGNTYYFQDNLARTAFTIQYSGAQASATMTVSNSTVILAAPSGTTVATLTLANYPTVAQLVSAINAIPSFQATIADGQNGASITANGLDTVTTPGDVKTSLYSCLANLQAVVDWLNSQGELFVTAVRHAGAGAPPAVLGTTYMTGGTSPAPITGDWTNALVALQTQDVQWIVAMTGTLSVQSAVDAHCQFMSGAGRKERRQICGPPAGTTIAAAEALGIQINSDRTTMVFPGYYQFNSSGQRTLYDSFYTAALVGAMFAGSSPGTPMTNKSIAVIGLELSLQNPSDTDALILSGICPVMQEPSGFTIERSVSTWLQNNNFNRVETSCGAAVDFTVRNVRNALSTLKGGRQDPVALGRAITLTETALDQLSVPAPAGPGTLVGIPGTANPPWQNIVATMTGDVLAVSFQCSPVIPTNFVPITVSIVPFAGTYSSASGTQGVTATGIT